MGYRTDFARVQGLGSAREGVGHWWAQRVTAVALIVLVPLFVFPFARALGGGHDAMVATYASWWHALVAVLFIMVALRHLSQGLQVVIEDYVPGKSLRTALLLGNTLINWALAAAGVLAVAKILFSA